MTRQLSSTLSMRQAPPSSATTAVPTRPWSPNRSATSSTYTWCCGRAEEPLHVGRLVAPGRRVELVRLVEHLHQPGDVVGRGAARSRPGSRASAGRRRASRSSCSSACRRRFAWYWPARCSSSFVTASSSKSVSSSSVARYCEASLGSSTVSTSGSIWRTSSRSTGLSSRKTSESRPMLSSVGDLRQVLGLVPPVDPQRAEVLLAQHHVLVVTQDRHDVVGVVLGADREQDAALRQVQQRLLEIDVLDPRRRRPQLDAFRAQLADDAAPERAVQVDHHALAGEPLQRLDVAHRRPRQLAQSRVGVPHAGHVVELAALPRLHPRPGPAPRAAAAGTCASPRPAPGPGRGSGPPSTARGRRRAGCRGCRAGCGPLKASSCTTSRALLRSAARARARRCCRGSRPCRAPAPRRTGRRARRGTDPRGRGRGTRRRGRRRRGRSPARGSPACTGCRARCRTPAPARPGGTRRRGTGRAGRGRRSSAARCGPAGRPTRPASPARDGRTWPWRRWGPARRGDRGLRAPRPRARRP